MTFFVAFGIGFIAVCAVVMVAALLASRRLTREMDRDAERIEEDW